MVCDRCKMVVKSELEALAVYPESVELGVVHIKEELTETQIASIDKRLSAVGFELLDTRKKKTVEKIKTAIIELVHYETDDHHVKHSEYLTGQLGKDYPSLSKLFSEKEGITIEQYVIQQKIERVKELLTYGELTLSEIAWQMGYSSVAALSAQFKKVMGVTPSAWKVVAGDRKTLDNVGNEVRKVK